MRGRTGYYSEAHLRRLELIRDLQDRGFSLEAIRQILEAWSRGADIEDLLGLHKIIVEPWSEEPHIVLTRGDVETLFPETREKPELVEEAVTLGLLAPADGGFEVPQVWIQAGVGLLRLGVSVAEMFELVGRLRTDARQLAQHLVEIISRQLFDPVADRALSAEAVHEMTRTVLDLRGLTVEVVRPFLARELEAATDEALEAFRRRAEQSPGTPA